MRDFPSCFGESGVQISDSSSKSQNNIVTCLYQSRIGGRECIITVTWSKGLMGQGLCVSVDDVADGRSLGKLEMKPGLLSKKKGSKGLNFDGYTMDVFWDISAAKFGSSPEPLQGFYLAVVFDLEMVLLLGDMVKEAYKKTGVNAVSSDVIYVAKRENLFGKRVFCTKAQFCGNGKVRDVVIECEMDGVSGPCLEIRVDRKRVMQVKRLVWKFRGNQTILVDGIPVEVFWDVHNWLFESVTGNAVFMFQTSFSADKLLSRTCSQGFGDMQRRSFSLVLHAWKNE